MAFSSVPNPFIAFLKISASERGLKDAIGTTVGEALSWKHERNQNMYIRVRRKQMSTYKLRISISLPIISLRSRRSTNRVIMCRGNRALLSVRLRRVGGIRSVIWIRLWLRISGLRLRICWLRWWESRLRGISRGCRLWIRISRRWSSLSRWHRWIWRLRISHRWLRSWWITWRCLRRISGGLLCRRVTRSWWVTRCWWITWLITGTEAWLSTGLRILRWVDGIRSTRLLSRHLSNVQIYCSVTF